MACRAGLHGCPWVQWRYEAFSMLVLCSVSIGSRMNPVVSNWLRNQCVSSKAQFLCVSGMYIGLKCPTMSHCIPKNSSSAPLSASQDREWSGITTLPCILDRCLHCWHTALGVFHFFHGVRCTMTLFARLFLHRPPVAWPATWL